MFGEFCQADTPILLFTRKYQSLITLKKGKERVHSTLFSHCYHIFNNFSNPHFIELRHLLF